MKTFLIILSLGVLVAGGTGCSKLLMDQALETMTVSKADDYFDLDGTQKDQLKKDSQKDLQSLKQDLFPQVASSLRGLEKEFTVEVPSPDQSGLMAKIFTDTESYLKKATAKFEVTAEKTVVSLREEQFQHFAKEIREDIEDSQEDTNSDEGALKQSVKRYTRTLEFWLGSLNREQKKSLREFLKTHPYPWALQNKSKHEVLEKFLSVRKSPEELKKFVRGFAVNYDAYRSVEFREALKVHQAAFHKYFGTILWPMIEKKQRQGLKENLLSRADSLDKLARQD